MGLARSLKCSESLTHGNHVGTTMEDRWTTMDRQDAITAVREEIARACRDAGRDPTTVTLVAVSKTFGAEAIEPVIAAGQRVFGENRVQEAKAKWPPLIARASRPRIASGRLAAIEQGEGGGGAVRRHPFGRSGKPGRGAWQGNRQAEAAAAAVRRDQYRRRGAKGRACCRKRPMRFSPPAAIATGSSFPA